MESQSQNPEFRINPENFHPCNFNFYMLLFVTVTKSSLQCTLSSKVTYLGCTTFYFPNVKI